MRGKRTKAKCTCTKTQSANSYTVLKVVTTSNWRALERLFSIASITMLLTVDVPNVSILFLMIGLI